MIWVEEVVPNEDIIRNILIRWSSTYDKLLFFFSIRIIFRNMRIKSLKQGNPIHIPPWRSLAVAMCLTFVVKTDPVLHTYHITINVLAILDLM